LFFEKINKISKSSAGLIKKERKIQITKIGGERGDITTDPMEVKKIIKG